MLCITSIYFPYHTQAYSYITFIMFLSLVSYLYTCAYHKFITYLMLHTHLMNISHAYQFISVLRKQCPNHTQHTYAVHL